MDPGGKIGSGAGLGVSEVEKAARAYNDMDISDRMKRREETSVALTKVGEVVQECEGRRTSRESNMMLLMAALAFVMLILARL